MRHPRKVPQTSSCISVSGGSCLMVSAALMLSALLSLCVCALMLPCITDTEIGPHDDDVVLFVMFFVYFDDVFLLS